MTKETILEKLKEGMTPKEIIEMGLGSRKTVYHWYKIYNEFDKIQQATLQFLMTYLTKKDKVFLIKTFFSGDEIRRAIGRGKIIPTVAGELREDDDNGNL